MGNFSPSLVVSDGQGNVVDIPEYTALGVFRRKPDGSEEIVKEILAEEWIPLPEGSQLMELPGRIPVGKDRKSGKIVTLEGDPKEKLVAVAAFVAPAYTITHHAVWKRLPNAPNLSLYAYCAVGWYKDRFYVAALRIDPDIRQDPSQFNQERIETAAKNFLESYSNNRLAEHLIKNCALTYGCPAAQNYLLNRWEMPLPTSRTCNSECLGCISLQKSTGICRSQFRIDFTPTAEEIIEIAVPHIETAPYPVVSFGQGCEGEPLMNPQLLIDTIKGIRKKTDKGTINLNTNASCPDIIGKLLGVGLDSMRVSMNSSRPEYYYRYFKPLNYTFKDVLKSIEIMKCKGGFVSINLFVFPGFTDQPDEIEALESLISDYGIDMIQWRNLNIDPEWYWKEMNPPAQDGIGIKKMIEYFKKEFPKLRYGYFNPYLATK
ncbi:MAG: radical SAM protein [Candidatus Marinimicrobia bacterium]|nr:radical SAM protein [Candidatus Neomarinimicrobiota bacterium]